MKGYVRQGVLSRQKVEDLLRARFLGRAYCVVERADDCRFDLFNADQADRLIADWPVGQAFSMTIEVRWQALDIDRYQVLVLAEQDADFSSFGLTNLDLGGDWMAIRHEGTQTGLYLWGQYSQELGHWTEVRIPRPLAYPAASQPRDNDLVRLGHIDYVAPNGAAQFVRLVEVHHGQS